MKIQSLISSSILAAQAFAAENQSYGLAASQGTINMEEDEYEWSIDDDVEFDDPEFLIKYDLIDRDEISTLKSGQSEKHSGIRVRNMGRIMKMSMFIQKQPAKNFIRQFKKYGCHCWPKGRTILGGQGRPVDDVDKTCKKLFNCHRCQVINSQNKCNPNEYTYKVRGLDTNGQRVVHCDGNKPGSCQRSLCECDLAFAHELASEISKGTYKEQNSKWKGFQQNDECRSSDFLNARSQIQRKEYDVPEGVTTHNGWACCGESYSNFTPYKPTRGSRCCNVDSNFTTYILERQDCCPDGSVKPFGECSS